MVPNEQQCLHGVQSKLIYEWIGFIFAVIAPGLSKQRPPLSIATSGPLLALHEEVEALLFLPEGKPYLMEVPVPKSALL